MALGDAVFYFSIYIISNITSSVPQLTLGGCGCRTAASGWPTTPWWRWPCWLPRAGRRRRIRLWRLWWTWLTGRT